MYHERIRFTQKPNDNIGDRQLCRIEQSNREHLDRLFNDTIACTSNDNRKIPAEYYQPITNNISENPSKDIQYNKNKNLLTAFMPIYRDQLQNFNSVFSERPAGARQIFHIQFSTTETFKPITHGTISMFVMRYSLFYSEKASNGIFPQKFHSFSNVYNF